MILALDFSSGEFNNHLLGKFVGLVLCSQEELIRRPFQRLKISSNGKPTSKFIVIS